MTSVNQNQSRPERKFPACSRVVHNRSTVNGIINGAAPVFRYPEIRLVDSNMQLNIITI